MAVAVITRTGKIKVATLNLVKISGNIENTGKNPVARTVHIYDSGSDNLRTETVSNDTTGDFEIIFPGEEAEELRIEAFADEAPGDENSQVHDYVNPIQFSTIV